MNGDLSLTRGWMDGMGRKGRTGQAGQDRQEAAHGGTYNTGG